ncbi:MAG: triose-phosphate isomerase [Candidatus Liptonbacteria bacterium CG11_big_fil_rev_8_21_14_0_20_35_14]|uniref:Triosephosphate isomerase n=1 Tax=Candidatus Liptonbacteria bacterium CG11_big_fil_rev_8_21_14_0_20_35_14 TaxID=1974634 RepID=A0A2H0N9T4_9BACT|nr:MAG: triose-phosphate isomerase [Candidatus Liptonbacteria bacterium CG11_big_fil_rev_8_21_14_0_20_35_14]
MPLKKNILIFNWKMNPETISEAILLFKKTNETIKDYKGEVVVTAPFVFLSSLVDLKRKLKSKIKLCAQNVFYHKNGAFTGEISLKQLESIQVNHVLIGHSERRKMGESDFLINKKVKEAVKADFNVIVAVGEKSKWPLFISERYVQYQLYRALIGVSSMRKIIVAYEPIWAIGTGENPSLGHIKVISRRLGKFGAPVLYGGSVTSQNIKSLIECESIDGALIGGASLSSIKVKNIISKIN